MSQLKLLLVDDDAVDRMSFRRTLRDAELDAEVIEAHDAASGISMLTGQVIDCVFSDFRMPAYDGLWFVREARARGIVTPIIVMTGHGDQETAVEVMKAGASDYLSKDALDSERLAALVRQALRIAGTEDAFRRVQEQLRVAVEIAELGTWDMTPATNTLGWSPRVREIFGLKPDTVVDYLDSFRFVHPDDRLLAETAIEAAMTSGGLDIEIRIVRDNDGMMRWIRSTGQLQFDRARRVSYLVGIVQDITDRKELEAQRLRLLDAEREARGRAEAATRMREDLMAVVSHDLRNPLASIITSAALLEALLEGQTAAVKHVLTIQRSSDRMKRLVSDLLDLASIDAGRFVIEPSEQRAAAMLRDCIEMLAPVAAEKSLGLAVGPVDQTMVVHCDRERILQVLSNVIGNAIKFTEHGGSIVASATLDGDMARFSVCDNGPGVDAREMSKLFDRYWQAKRDSRKGLGLGLSISRGIVEAHDGSIWAENNPERGATFHFTLPLPKS